MSEVQKRPSGWLKKGALTAGVSAFVGAASGFVAKMFLGKHTETKEIPLTWDNLTDDVLFKAIGQKWQSYSNGADLSTKQGWIEMTTSLRDSGNTVQAENALKDLFDVQAMSQQGYSFSGFVSKEQLADYITRQDVTDSARTVINEKAAEAFESKWGFPVTSSDGKFATEIARLNDPAKTEELINDRFVVESWTNQTTLTTDKLDQYVNDYYGAGTYDLSSMTSQEKSQLVLDYLNSNHRSGLERAGVKDGLISNMTPEDLTRMAYNEYVEDGNASGSLFQNYYQYMQVKTTHDNVVVDMRDIYTSFSDNADISVINNNIAVRRNGILTDAIEDKYSITDVNVDLSKPDADLLTKVDPSAKDDFVDNLINSGAYIRDSKMPIPEDAMDMAARTGTTDIINDYIANGDSTTIEQVVGTLGDTEITGISGLGTVITCGVMLGFYLHKQKQIKKICAENPEAAAAYDKYVKEQQQQKEDAKAAKKAKKHGKHVVEDDSAEDSDEMVLGKR